MNLLTIEQVNQKGNKQVSAVVKRKPPAAGMGRVKGSQNKITKALKDIILGSLDMAGNEQYLLWLSKENPGAYAALIGKVLPLKVTGEDGGPVLIITGVRRAEDDTPKP